MSDLNTGLYTTSVRPAVEWRLTPTSGRDRGCMRPALHALFRDARSITPRIDVWSDRRRSGPRADRVSRASARRASAVSAPDQLQGDRSASHDPVCPEGRAMAPIRLQWLEHAAWWVANRSCRSRRTRRASTSKVTLTIGTASTPRNTRPRGYITTIVPHRSSPNISSSTTLQPSLNLRPPTLLRLLHEPFPRTSTSPPKIPLQDRYRLAGCAKRNRQVSRQREGRQVGRASRGGLGVDTSTIGCRRCAEPRLAFPPMLPSRVRPRLLLARGAEWPQEALARDEAAGSGSSARLASLSRRVSRPERGQRDSAGADIDPDSGFDTGRRPAGRLDCYRYIPRRLHRAECDARSQCRRSHRPISGGERS